MHCAAVRWYSWNIRALLGFQSRDRNDTVNPLHERRIQRENKRKPAEQVFPLSEFRVSSFASASFSLYPKEHTSFDLDRLQGGCVFNNSTFSTSPFFLVISWLSDKLKTSDYNLPDIQLLSTCAVIKKNTLLKNRHQQCFLGVNKWREQFYHSFINRIWERKLNIYRILAVFLLADGTITFKFTNLESWNSY